MVQVVIWQIFASFLKPACATAPAGRDALKQLFRANLGRFAKLHGYLYVATDICTFIFNYFYIIVVSLFHPCLTAGRLQDRRQRKGKPAQILTFMTPRVVYGFRLHQW